MQPALRFISDETGATAIEYGLIAGLVALAGVFSMAEVGQALNDFMLGTATKLVLPT